MCDQMRETEAAAYKDFGHCREVQAIFSEAVNNANPLVSRKLYKPLDVVDTEVTGLAPTCQATTS